ncbi:MAG: ribonuclease Y [Magnetococcales bacterium]|nr:ribonuclease Y [Magnetococcales bacterium]
MNVLVALVLGALLGMLVALGVWLTQRRRLAERQKEREERSRLALESLEEKRRAAEREAELREKDARHRIREEVERELEERNRELQQQKRRLEKREETLDRKMDQLDQREQEVDQRRGGLEAEERELEKEKERTRELQAGIFTRLEEIALLTAEQAKELLIAEIRDQARLESAKLLKQIEEETRREARKRSSEIIATAIQRYAGESVAEHTVSVVALPSEEMKGRIIGREGRNIRALEAATGCDLIIDDTPEAVVISGFDPVRRQVAKRALEELIADGRIHPARIEEVARKTRKGISNEIREAGEQALLDAGVHGAHRDIVRLLGTLKFRTSYTQNVLNHSVEVASFAGIMADELGLDANIARRCGLLHDIGKAVDHETQGSHAVIGGQLAKKFKENPVVVNAIWSHHFDIEPTSVYGPLTNAADALSAARPGARRENLETYIKRLENLERIATDFGGVDKAYAIQAGRELRVIVQSDKVDDDHATLLARDIALRVENEMTYPGQIRVTVIRETRATGVAH